MVGFFVHLLRCHPDDFESKVKSKQSMKHLDSESGKSNSKFDFDSVLGAASGIAGQDFIGPLTDLVDFLDGACRIHPYISVAVTPFKVHWPSSFVVLP